MRNKRKILGRFVSPLPVLKGEQVSNASSMTKLNFISA
jgi:hypothetical protein